MIPYSPIEDWQLTMDNPVAWTSETMNYYYKSVYIHKV